MVTAHEFDVPPTELDEVQPRDGTRAALRQLPSKLRVRFEIVRELSSQGSEADVFLVRALDDSGIYVVKLYRGNKHPKANVLEAVRVSESEHLLRIHEYGESDGHWFELLEYAEFGTLRGVLSAGALSSTQCDALLRQLGQALFDLHSRNIFHRDVKPDNILIMAKTPLRIALSDYGIASETDSTSRATGWAGTAIYMAPEIVGKAPEPDGSFKHLISAACDYWALGMVLTEALAGSHPFKNVGIAVAYSHLATKPIDVSNVPVEWRRLCRGLLTRDPKNRWGRDQVERWIAGERETIPLVQGVPTVEHIYPFNGKEYDALSELVSDFSKKDNWSKGTAEIQQGHLTDWLRKCSQYEAASFVEEIRNDRTFTDDFRLYLIVAHFCPALPPVWKGQTLDQKNLLALAVRQGDASLTVLSDVFDRQLLCHPRLEKRENTRRLGQDWIKAVAENEAFWALEPLRALASTQRGDRRIELANALLASCDATTRNNLLRQIQTMTQDSAAQRCDWFVRQIALAASQPGTMHALARLGNEAASQGQAVIAEEARQAKAEQDATLWRQRRKAIVMRASVFGLALGSVMGALRYWMVSSQPFYWMPWSFSEGFERQPWMGSFRIVIDIYWCLWHRSAHFYSPFS